MKTFNFYKGDTLFSTNTNSINLLSAISNTFNINYSQLTSHISSLSHDYNKPTNGVYSFWFNGRYYTALWVEKVQRLNKKENYYTSFKLAKTL